MSALDVYTEFLPKLTSVLPIKDPTFTARLVQKGLFAGNMKAKVRSFSTEAEANEYFLEKVVEDPLKDEDDPDLEPLEKLLSIMKAYSKSLRKLAESISEELSSSGGSGGGSGGSRSGVSPECKAAIEKIKSNYDALMRMPIDSILGSLYGKNIITFDQKKEIQGLSPESKRATFVLDEVLLRTLMAGVIDTYTEFVKLLKEKGDDEDDAVLSKLSQDLEKMKC